MRKLIRAIGLLLVRLMGSSMKDARTGKSLGKAFVICWGGKIHLIGLRGGVVPVFLPQKRLTYWKQEIGFTTYPPPDFPRVKEN